jgi:hypothetical protein
MLWPAASDRALTFSYQGLQDCRSSSPIKGPEYEALSLRLAPNRPCMTLVLVVIMNRPPTCPRLSDEREKQGVIFHGVALLIIIVGIVLYNR